MTRGRGPRNEGGVTPKPGIPLNEPRLAELIIRYAVEVWGPESDVDPEADNASMRADLETFLDAPEREARGIPLIPEGEALDWYRLIGEWANDHSIYTKDWPDTVEVQALQAFLDELLSQVPATPPSSRGIPLIDVELLREAMEAANLRAPYRGTADDWAPLIVEEYTRLASSPVEEGERP